MSELKFDKTVSIGNLITLLTVCVGLVVGYAKLQAKTDTNSEKIESMNTIIKTMPENYINRNEFRAQEERLTRIEDKLDRLITIQLERND